MAVNSLGILDLIQIAAHGLASKTQYRVYLADSNRPPFGALEPLALLKTNPDGAGIVQAIGPLKRLAQRGSTALLAPLRRFLIVADSHDTSQVVLREATPSAER
ncbi:MAG TPA: hypothetical protein VJN39_04765 [Gemmatimonadales bacterium]|nr:hypothetical protein [Gemmatimonadales bacterium]